MSILYDTAARVKKQQAALNAVLSRPELYEDGKKGEVTKAAVKAVKKAAAKVDLPKTLKLGGSFTLAGAIAVFQALAALYDTHSAELGSLWAVLTTQDGWRLILDDNRLVQVLGGLSAFFGGTWGLINGARKAWF